MKTKWNAGRESGEERGQAEGGESWRRKRIRRRNKEKDNVEKYREERQKTNKNEVGT